MGDIYCRSIFGMEHPRVGPAFDWRREGKGNNLTAKRFNCSTASINSLQRRSRDLYNASDVSCRRICRKSRLKTSEGVPAGARRVERDLEVRRSRQVGAYILATPFPI